MKSTIYRDDPAELNHLLTHAMHCISDCVSITDMEEKIMYVNDAFLSTYGYRMNEILGQHVHILRSEKNKPESIRGIYQETLAGGWEGELMNRTASGTEFMINLTTSVVSDREGRPFAIMGIARDISEKKRMEALSAEKDARYLAVFEHSPLGIGLATEDGRVVEANSAMERLTGYSLAELGTMNLADIYFDPDDRTKFVEGMNQTGFVHEYPVRLKNKSGSIIDTLLYVTKIILHGRIMFHTICQDLTEQKRTETRLREIAESYEGLFNSVSDAIYILNEEGIFIDVNDGAVKMYGYPKDVLIGKTPVFVSADGMNDLQDIALKVQKAFNGEFQQFEFWGKRSNGEPFLKDVRITNGIYHGKKVSLAMAVDITYRKKIEEELQLSETRLKSIFKSAPAGIGLMSGDRTFIDVNPFCCDLLGYSREELLGRNVLFIYPDIQEYERVGEEKYAMMKKNGTGVIETKWKRKDGQLIDILLSSTMLDVNNLNKGVIFNALNISPLKEAQQELQLRARELEKFNNLMVGREIKMIELKKEINALLIGTGKEPKYFIPENNDE